MLTESSLSTNVVRLCAASAWFAIAAQSVLAQQAVILGQAQCAACHGSEGQAWLQSPHATGAFQNLSHDKAPEFARAMGVSGNLSAAMCATCHATELTGSATSGVSCESCHNPAGPKGGGWFAVHSDYGIAFTGQGSPIGLRDQEPAAHRASRVARAAELGMIGTDDVFDIAKNCLECHTVPNEKLVNAGHPTSKRFEIVRWSQGVVRHNFAIEQSTNAESPSLWLKSIPARPSRNPENRKKLMFVAGQLADLEVSLRARANAADGDYGRAFNDRIDDAIGELKDVSHIAEVQQAVLAVNGIDKSRLKQFGGGDAQFFAKAAEAVLAAAKAFVNNHPDGDDLGNVKTPRRSEGDPFKP
jgi:hypothetical protein